MSDSDDDGPSRRQVAKAARKKAGDRSSELARTLMLMSDATLEKMDLGDELRIPIERARAVKSMVARRRAERTLAGDLRGLDLADLRKRLANVEQHGVGEPELFHRAEKWRARLIAEPGAAAEFPGGTDEPMPRLIAQAKRESTTGKPPGAARALFRHVITVLKAEARAAELAAAESDDA